jgi:hypothetical protein
MILKLSMLVSCAALTIGAQELVQPNLDGFKYPALARSARIEGTVEFVVKLDGIQLLSGHPMLAAVAKSNLEKWAAHYTVYAPLSVTYVFRLRETDMPIIEASEPIGDGFHRFFLRLFHRPLTRRVIEQHCVDSDDSSVGFKNVTKNGFQSIEIDIEAVARCVQANVAAIAALPALIRSIKGRP